MLRTSFHWRCSVFLRFASPEMLPRVPLYQVVDVEFVPGTRLPLYVGRHTEAGMTMVPVVIPLVPGTTTGIHFTYALIRTYLLY